MTLGARLGSGAYDALDLVKRLDHLQAGGHVDRWVLVVGEGGLFVGNGIFV